MAFSVNTNTGAMAALQSLNATNRGLDTVQSRINTGLAVGSTKDDRRPSRLPRRFAAKWVA